MRYVLASTLLLMATLSPAALAQSNEQAAASALITPGLWEINVQVESPIAGPPETTEVCLSGDEAKLKKPKNKAKDDCQASDVPAAPNEVAIAVDCPKLKQATTMKFAYFGDRYEGTAITNMNGVEIRTKYTARRIGACEAAPPSPIGDGK